MPEIDAMCTLAPPPRAADSAANRDAKPPTERLVAFAQRLAKDKKAQLPRGYDKDFEICRKFLDQHAA